MDAGDLAIIGDDLGNPGLGALGDVDGDGDANCVDFAWLQRYTGVEIC